MANQTVPITLSWGPVTTDFQAENINQLGEKLCQQIAAAIRADVSFFLETANDPASFITNLIYNTSQGVFKFWNTGTGRYTAITQFTVGDIKNTVIGTDSIATGWVILDGRAIAAIPGITGAQQAALTAALGGGPNLPIVRPANVVGLPTDGAFSGIVWPPSIEPVVTPAAGVISPGLPFTAPNPSDTEVQAFADQVEILRTSAQDAFDVTKQIQAQAEFVLNALNNQVAPIIYAAIFCGYP